MSDFLKSLKVSKPSVGDEDVKVIQRCQCLHVMANESLSPTGTYQVSKSLSVACVWHF